MSSDFQAAGSEDLPNSARFHLDYIAALHFVNRLFLPPLAMLLVVGVFPKPQNPRRVQHKRCNIILSFGERV